ncbi:hypothetical protein FMK81_01490 [Klebsiella oxytoca]|nr:hypothetical protein [Klebsiella oxytoca]
MAIHDAGMFTVKEINRLKILHDVIDRGPGLLNLALTNMCQADYAVVTRTQVNPPGILLTYRLHIAVLSCQHPF